MDSEDYLPVLKDNYPGAIAQCETRGCELPATQEMSGEVLCQQCIDSFRRDACSDPEPAVEVISIETNDSDQIPDNVITVEFAARFNEIPEAVAA